MSDCARCHAREGAVRFILGPKAQAALRLDVAEGAFCTECSHEITDGKYPQDVVLEYGGDHGEG